MQKMGLAASATLCLLAATSARTQTLSLQQLTTGLNTVVGITHAGDGSGRLFLTEQVGRIRIHNGTSLLTTPFLDIDPLVRCCGEEGMLSTAFHPNYASNGFFFVYYTNNNGDQVVARYTRSAGNPNVADPATAKIIITIPHPGQSNHNGGPLKFGPDGFLYVATGDGGGGGDPGENAQDLTEVLGKQLRLDIDTAAPYLIPPSNPFVGVPGARGEIWAYGLRNPWRFTFDRQTGDMFIGDVGQGQREEIDFQPAGVGGLNYGWDDMEGSLCYEPSSGCLTANRVLPILEVNHNSGDCAIVGGYRYRGTAIPSLAGRYVHSDNCTGRIRIGTQGGGGTWTQVVDQDTPFNIYTFGEDQNGELYASSGGTIHRLVSAIPVASIADRTQGEGAGPAVFTVTLGSGIGQQTTVQYSTTPGTATAGTDYTAASGIITFPPNQTSRTVSIPLVNDALDEDDETFFVNLTAPSGISIGDGQAQGTITDDDPLPALTAADCAALEGDAGSNPCAFGVTLTPPSGRAVAVGYTTQNGSATAGTDYTTASGTLSFAAGVTSGVVPVSVLGDTALEGTETFALALASPTNATLADAQGDGVIVDDDAPSLSSLELTHGSRVSADLAGGAPDLYRLGQSPRASYEIVLDEVSGDAVPGLVVERLASDNTTVLQSAAVTGTGASASLRWQNPLSAPVPGEHIRVTSPACGSGCAADDTYRLRLYETTLSGPRFNNAGGQGTVLQIQNTTAGSVNGRVFFWAANGTLIASTPFTLTAHASIAMNTSAMGVLAGQSGSLTVSHNAGYGGITGKSVALDPATGASFDTPLVSRPR
jgi:glucose/arabinose dehydrogenase